MLLFVWDNHSFIISKFSVSISGIISSTYNNPLFRFGPACKWDHSDGNDALANHLVFGGFKLECAQPQCF